MGQNTPGKLVQSEQITGEGCDTPVGQELFEDSWEQVGDSPSLCDANEYWQLLYMPSECMIYRRICRGNKIKASSSSVCKHYYSI